MKMFCGFALAVLLFAAMTLQAELPTKKVLTLGDGKEVGRGRQRPKPGSEEPQS